MFEDLLTDETRYMISELKNVILLILTIIDLVFIFLSTIYSFNFTVENLFADYDFLVCLLLFIDLANEYYNYNGNLRDFLIKDKNLFAIISILPYDLLFRYFSVFRLFRFIKIIKLVRVYNIKRDYKSLEYFIQHHLFKLLFIILIVYTGISSALLIILDDSVTNLGEALWFIIVTASTVGYGDITPISPMGKALTILTILIGILFVAIFTAYLSAIYNEKPEMETRNTLMKYLKKFEHHNKKSNVEFQLIFNKLNKLEEENKQLKERLSLMDEKLDEISEKMN